MSGGNKSAADERRSTMRKRAERALREQEKVTEERRAKTAKLRAMRLAQEDANNETTDNGKPNPDSEDNNATRPLPKTHRSQF